MHLTLLDYLLWAACPVSMAVLLAVMYMRNLHQAYPYFFAYAMLQVVCHPTLFLISRRSYAAYFFAYYVTEAGSIVLAVAVLWDVFKNALGLYECAGRFALTAFRYCVPLILGLIVVIGIESYPGPAGAWSHWLLSGLSVTRLVQLALLLLLFLFRKYLGVSSSNVVFGVALGFALYAAVDMLVADEFLHKLTNPQILRQADSLVYFLATLIWLGYAIGGSTQPDIHQEPRFPVFPRSRAFLNSLAGPPQ